MGLLERCGSISGPNSLDRMFLGASKVIQSMMEEVTRGPVRVLPCGQSRGGTHGQTRGKSPIMPPLASALMPEQIWMG